MTSNVPPQNISGQPKRTSFSAYPNSNASILLDKAKMGIRGSTPDSEALISSDDEHEYIHRIQSLTSNPNTKATRRASWFTESQSSTRKPSLGGPGPFSPISPGTMPSSVDQPPWIATTSSATTSSIGKGHGSSSSFPWGNTIWNTDAPKPPQRLAEVIPSPTSATPSNTTNIHQEEHTLRSPSLTRDVNDRNFPFSIPLQPTPKTYRSQSYSVGQIDPDMSSSQGNATNSNVFNGVKRGSSYAGSYQRSSRPGPLGEGILDSNPLGQLREVEDDEDASNVSPLSAYRGEIRTIEDLAGENALLRQQLAANQGHSSRNMRTSLPTQRPRLSDQYYHQRLQDPSRESLGNQDVDGPSAYNSADSRSSLGRRFSEYGTGAGPHYALDLNMNPNSRAMEHAKRGQWQSSLGFSRADDPPKSRRHSFAEMPTRHNSLGSADHEDITKPLRELNISPTAPLDQTDELGDGSSRLSHGDPSKLSFSFSPTSRATEVEMVLSARHSYERDFAVKYFSQPNYSPRDFGDFQALSSSSLHQHYAHSQSVRAPNYGMPQSRPGQLLYIVTFKCLRADVFYIQDGTGLRVKKGDLVIVEADRGTDLGTVQSDPISWVEAKHLKEDYTRRHHEWLMAFSHHTQDGTVAGPNPNGAALVPNATNASGNAGFQDLPSGDIKPKMIKRLAQPHEIATLREKEGGEAKAKRMCQQKVVDHRLNMEILDAEFQMDWKKLTFFYFADAYINFNPLVTDLFKIYKTRIWMSAINTAAIASHHAGPKSSAMSLRAGSAREYDEFRPGQYSQTDSAGPSHSTMANFNGLFNGNRLVAYDHAYHQPLAPHGYEHRQVSPFVDYRTSNQQAAAFPAQYGSASGFAPGVHHTSSLGPAHDVGVNSSTTRRPDPQDWKNTFPGIHIGR